MPVTETLRRLNNRTAGVDVQELTSALNAHLPVRLVGLPDVVRNRMSAAGSPASWRSHYSTRSALSALSAWSFGSLGSLGSLGSIASIGSLGSVASIGSAGSIGSIGSVGSILSIGSVGSVLAIGERRLAGDVSVESMTHAVALAAVAAAVMTAMRHRAAIAT